MGPQLQQAALGVCPSATLWVGSLPGNQGPVSLIPFSKEKATYVTILCATSVNVSSLHDICFTSVSLWGKKSVFLKC